MLGTRKLIADTFCEVHDLLKHCVDDEFWDFSTHKFQPGAVYLVGREQFLEHVGQIAELAAQRQALFVLSNPHEGSDTMRGLVARLGIESLVKQQRILILGGGDMDSSWPCLQYDSFLPKLYDYQENVAASTAVEDIFAKKQKPYKFLFLNGRMRSHRKYLLERLDTEGLLSQSLWTVLDAKPASNRTIKLIHNGQDLMTTVRPARTLPPYYEVDRYSHLSNPASADSYVKFNLFDNQWGEIYLKPEPYIDTYFSLISETVFEYPHSFRTEKIWKPIAIGHPFVVAANAGFYRDLHDLGFQTFGHVVDESFDQIEDNQKRLERIADTVRWLCQQDLAKFLEECYTVCKYNQNHLAQMREQVRREFPAQFEQFISQYE